MNGLIRGNPAVSRRKLKKRIPTLGFALSCEVPQDEVDRGLLSLPAHFSANLIVDLASQFSYPTLNCPANATSGGFYAASGAQVGGVVDMGQCNTYCNVQLTGIPQIPATSGELRVAIQTSNSTASGTFGDPTSGLPAGALPTWFSSGGILFLNSGGLLGGTRGAAASGQYINSGFSEFAAFQRPGQYARAIALASGFYAGGLNVNFVSQLRTTGSGGGSSQAPGSGVPSV